MKKIFSLLLAVGLLLSSAGAVYADNVSQIIGDGNIVVFVDVPDNYWAKDAIYDFAKRGIVQGTGENSFEPEAGVTREQFAKMLVLTFSAPLTSPSEATFADVPKDKWSYTYIETSKDFLTGYANPFGGAPSFHPETNATREDIAVSLVRMMGLTDKDVNNANYARNFRDAGDISPALLPYVSLAAERGLIKGYEDGTFGPQRGITRAETVTLLNRATKQAVTNIGAELELSANVVTGDNPKEVTIMISTEEGAKVTIDGQSVKMESDYDGGYAGAFLYTFTEEGTKAFTVEASKAGKKKSVQVTAKYEIGVPVLTITTCPTTSDKSSVTISGNVSDVNDDASDINVTVNGKSVYPNYSGSWSTLLTLTEGSNTVTIVATNSLGKSTTDTRTITFGVGAPKLTITTCPTTSDKSSVTISGNVSDVNDDASDINVTVNGKSVYPNYSGSWSTLLTLTEGSNTVTIVATNSLGKSTTDTRTITFGVGAPKLTITTCPTTSDKSSVTISGNVSDVNDDASDINVTVNGKAVYPNYSGSWSTLLTLTEGSNTVTIVATNSLGKSTTDTRTITFGVGAPKLTITTCPTTSDKSSVTISGNVSDVNDDASDINVTVNGKAVYPNYSGSWSTLLTLTEGSNTVTIVATNSLGKSTTETRTITLTVGEPTISFINCPETTVQKSIAIIGTIGGEKDGVYLFVNDKQWSVSSNGRFEQSVTLIEGVNTFTFRAVNSYGKETTVTKKITYAVPNLDAGE